MEKPKTKKPARATLPPLAETWTPPDYDISDASALQALLRGDANEDQQKRALDWIINHASGTYEMPYRSGKQDDTTFGLGRMFVGQQIVKLIKLNLGKMRKTENE